MRQDVINMNRLSIHLGRNEIENPVIMYSTGMMAKKNPI